ncbi:MAG: hypothetical protein H8F28_03415 [Fibrella sp.]|nr:hypothetical protein [Armatimonadota bacterium]
MKSNNDTCSAPQLEARLVSEAQSNGLNNVRQCKSLAATLRHMQLAVIRAQPHAVSLIGVQSRREEIWAIRDFCAANPNWTKTAVDDVENAPKPTPIITTERGFGSSEAFNTARNADFD